MKYKLVNQQTNEEHLCDKVTIDGFDYYISDEKPIDNQFYYDSFLHKIFLAKSIIIKDDINFDDRIYYDNDGRCSRLENCQKVIATNNPNIDIHKVVDEIEEIAKNMGINVLDYDGYGFIKGYNKSQETHPNSDEDMKSFLKFSIEYRRYNDLEGLSKTSEELLQLWKEQRTKIVYYEN